MTSGTQEHGSLPDGVLTFLFADIEGSTELARTLRDRWPAVLDEHGRIVAEAVARHGGRQVATEGDGTFAAFIEPVRALEAAADIQRAVAAHSWPAPLAVRAGMHTGTAFRTERNYAGVAVHEASRVCDAAHGGQVLVSAVLRELASGVLPGGVELRELGAYRLKGFPDPRPLFQLVAPGLPDGFPPPRAAPARRDNLPAAAASFVGRTHDLERVRVLLEEHRLVTLTGPGGAGKTRLAVEAGRSDRSRDVWLVELAALSRPELVPDRVAGVLGRSDGGSALDAIVEALGPSETLLVLDNCEHLLPACAALARAILESCPGTRIVATSRSPLGLPHERVFPVGPLPSEDAVRLFVERARAVRPDIDLGGSVVPAVSRICGALDGLPLALELAAARCRALTPQEIEALLADRFRLLTGGGGAPHHRTLRTAIEWSLELLGDEERTLFRRLAVFAGGCGLDDAVAVCDAGDTVSVLDLLTSLVERSLLVASSRDGHTRYTMLASVHALAGERLEQAGEADELRHRHLERVARAVRETVRDVHGPRQAGALERLDELEDDIRAALRLARDEDPAGVFAELVTLLVPYWHLRWRTDEARERAQEALDVVPEGAPGRLRLVQRAAEVFARIDDTDAAARLLEEALRTARASGDVAEQAAALRGLGDLAVGRNDLTEALRLLGEALTLYRRTSDELNVLKVLESIGAAEVRMGDLAAAEANLAEALRGYRAAGSPRDVARTQMHMAHVAEQRGDIDRAEALLLDTLAIDQEIGSPNGVASALHELGTVAIARGDPPAARERFAQALAMARELGIRRTEANCLLNLAAVTDEAGEAERLYDEAIELHRALGNQGGVAVGLFHLAQIARSRGDIDLASERFEASAGLFRASGARLNLARVLCTAAALHVGSGRYAEAEAALDEAVPVFEEAGVDQDLRRALVTRAALERVRGRAERAVELALAAGAVPDEVRAEAWEELARIAASRGDGHLAARLLGAASAAAGRPGPDAVAASLGGFGLEPAVLEQEWTAGRREPDAVIAQVRSGVLVLAGTRGRGLAAQATAGRATFRRDGDGWVLAFAAAPFRLSDAKGLRCLHHLLTHAGRELHCTELAALAEGVAAASGRASTDLHAGDGDAIPVLDERAKAEYRQRLNELREELEEARAWEDGERAARVQGDIDELVEQLARGIGLGGRDRKTGSTAERARINVTRAIKRAAEAIAERDAALARHLSDAVRTGTFCVYDPDPGRPVEWTL